MRCLLTGMSILTLLVASVWPVSVRAQGEEGAAPAAKAEKGAPKANPGKAGGEAAPAIPALPKPKEASPYLYEPKTPDEFVQAIVQTVDLARPNLARNYLDRLLESELTDEQVLGLRDKFGGAVFLLLSGIPELRPAITTFVDRMNKIAERRARDAGYINGMIAKLQGTPEERAQAIVDLEYAGAVAVPYLLQVIQSEQRAKEHDTIFDVVARMKGRAVPVLVAALDASDIRFRAHVATMLGNSGDQRAVSALWYPAFAESEAMPVKIAARMALAKLLRVRPIELEALSEASAGIRLLKLARQNFRQETLPQPEEDGKVKVWQWDPRSSLVTLQVLNPQEASDIQGFRYARAALNLSPDAREVQTLFLALALSRDLKGLAWNEQYRNGPGTAYDLALSAGPEVVGDVVVESLSSGRPQTAVVALKVLEQIGTAAQLRGVGAKTSPFLQALNFPDNRVQFAAAAAILQVDPATPFMGSSRVIAVLQRAINNEVPPRAVVARSDIEKASVTGGIFGQLGYATDVVTTGRECFKIASERVDVQLIVLHPSLVDWPLLQTLANLRADARTASIPIVIYGSPNSIKDLHVTITTQMQNRKQFEDKGDISSKVRALAQSFPLVTYVLESQTREQLESQLNPFLARLKSPPLTQPQRAAMKAQALSWMAHIATGRRQKIFNLTGTEELLASAALDPNLAADALQALGEITTIKAQQLIAGVALNTTLEPRVREIAVNKLTFHIQRFGLLIPNDTLSKLKKAQTETETAGLRSAFDGLEGSLRPNAHLVGERLRAFNSTIGVNP